MNELKWENSYMDWKEFKNFYRLRFSSLPSAHEYCQKVKVKYFNENVEIRAMGRFVYLPKDISLEKLNKLMSSK